jgi:isoleucyl-tRNA synthetase
LHFVLVELSKLMAPFTPFIAEEIYKNLAGRESVHLAEFPSPTPVTLRINESEKVSVSEEIITEMNNVRDIVSEGLQLRAKSGIKVRQPLKEASIKYQVSSEELISIIKEELNVKEVRFDKDMEENIKLDTEITEDLKLEGIAREIIRFIQEMRKEAGYNVDNRIEVFYSEASPVFDKFGDIIAKEILAEKIVLEKMKEFDLEKEFEIDGEKFAIQIKKR